MAQGSHDMESLLKAKSFSQLDAEERAFVLGHVEDEGEYERIRRMMKMIADVPEAPLAVEPGFRERLLEVAADSTSDAKGSSIPIYRRSWVIWTVTGAAATLLAAVLWFFRGNEEKLTSGQVAHVEQPIRVETGGSSPKQVPADDSEVREPEGKGEVTEHEPEPMTETREPSAREDDEGNTHIAMKQSIPLNNDKQSGNRASYQWVPDSTPVPDLTMDQSGGYLSQYGNAYIAPEQSVADSLTVVSSFTATNFAMIQQTPQAEVSEVTAAVARAESIGAGGTRKAMSGDEEKLSAARPLRKDIDLLPLLFVAKGN